MLVLAGKFFHFYVESIHNIQNGTVSAVEKLMSASHEIMWPRNYEPRNKKFEMCNDLISFLKKSHLGWGRDIVDTHGKPFVVNLVDALWYADGHWPKFATRSKPLPPLFKATMFLRRTKRKSGVVLSMQVWCSMLGDWTIFCSNLGLEGPLGCRLEKQWR